MTVCVYTIHTTHIIRTVCVCTYIHVLYVVQRSAHVTCMKCQIGINGHLQKISLYKLKGRTWMCSGVVYCGVAIPFFV